MGTVKATSPSKPQEDFAFVTHEDTRDLRWAKTFASLIAFTNLRDELHVSDLLAGIYVANWERVSEFWAHARQFEDLVAEHCDWSEPRWLTWQRWEHESMNEREGFRFPLTLWFRGKKLGKRRFFGTMFRASQEWKQVFESAEHMTPHTVVSPAPWLKGRVMPLLTPEVMILALTRTEGISIGDRLRKSGLMIEKLEEAAMRPIQSPEKLLF
jgi:hypothetical protein